MDSNDRRMVSRWIREDTLLVRRLLHDKIRIELPLPPRRMADRTLPNPILVIPSPTLVIRSILVSNSSNNSNSSNKIPDIYPPLEILPEIAISPLILLHRRNISPSSSNNGTTNPNDSLPLALLPPVHIILLNRIPRQLLRRTRCDQMDQEEEVERISSNINNNNSQTLNNNNNSSSSTTRISNSSEGITRCSNSDYGSSNRINRIYRERAN